jgi:hypothetical protein
MRALRNDRRSLRAVAALVLLLYGALLSFAILPELHEKLHSSAKHVDHHCAITLIAGGQIEVSGCDNLLPPAPTFHLVSSEVDCPAGFCRFELLPPGRAPPSIFS